MQQRKQRISARGLKQAARGHWMEIFQVLAPDAVHALKKPGTHVVCPIHGGVDGDGYRVFKDFNETGGGICNTCGGFKDGFDHLMWLNGWTFPETLEAVAQVLGYREYDDAGRVPPRRTQDDPQRAAAEEAERKKREQEDARLRQKLDELWTQAVPLTDPSAEPVRLYLARRGLSLKYALNMPELRFHPKVAYYHEKKLKGYYPAMVSLVFDAAGKPVTLHRTYLDWEGYKAPVPKAKKLMPYPSDRDASGGAIRLMRSAGPVLAFTEGIETALAVIEATEGRLPVWPTYSDTMLANVCPPENVQLACFYGDQDRSEAGRKAVIKAKERLWARGITVQGFIPNEMIPETAKGVDWLDVYRRYGEDGVPFPESVEQRLLQGGE